MNPNILLNNDIDAESIAKINLKELEANAIEIFRDDDSVYIVEARNVEGNANNWNHTIETEVALLPAQPKRYLYLEIPIFLLNFATTLSATVYTNQLLYISCTTIFSYSITDCKPMLSFGNADPVSQQIKDRVQTFVSKIILTNSLISAIIPAILSLFLGPWSDKFGRRPILLVTFAAVFISYVIITILALSNANHSMNPWVYILFSIPLAVCGGSCSMMVIVYCFISDVAPAKVIAIRMYLNAVAVSIGGALGSLASSYLFAATNVATIFGISSALSLLAFIYIIAFVEESLKPQLIQSGSKLHGLFNYKLVVQLFHTCCGRRPKFDRAILWLSMISLIIINFIAQGQAYVFYLYLLKQFDITFNGYNIYNVSSSVIHIVGGIIALKLMGRYFKMSIINITTLAALCSVQQSVILAMAEHYWESYLGSVAGFMSGTTSALLLAIIAFVVPPNEVGKIYALTTCLQTLAPLASTPMYAAIYNVMLLSFPGLFNLISAVLYLVCFFLTITILGIQKSTQNIIGPVALGICS